MMLFLDPFAYLFFNNKASSQPKNQIGRNAASLDFLKGSMSVPFGCSCYCFCPHGTELLIILSLILFVLLFCQIWDAATNNFFLSHLTTSRIHVNFFRPTSY